MCVCDTAQVCIKKHKLNTSSRECVIVAHLEHVDQHLSSFCFNVCFLRSQIEGFDVKRVDEYHLTGISLDIFVRWERRLASSTDNRNEARGEGRAKPEQKKIPDHHYSEGIVSLPAVHNHVVRDRTFMEGTVGTLAVSPCFLA